MIVAIAIAVVIFALLVAQTYRFREAEKRFQTELAREREESRKRYDSEIPVVIESLMPRTKPVDSKWPFANKR